MSLMNISCGGDPGENGVSLVLSTEPLIRWLSKDWEVITVMSTVNMWAFPQVFCRRNFRQCHQWLGERGELGGCCATEKKIQNVSGKEAGKKWQKLLRHQIQWFLKCYLRALTTLTDCRGRGWNQKVVNWGRSWRWGDWATFSRNSLESVGANGKSVIGLRVKKGRDFFLFFFFFR